MSEDQNQPVADASKVQTNSSLELNKTSDKDEQQNVANSESDTKKEQSQNTAVQNVKKDQPADATLGVSATTETPASNQGTSPVTSDAVPKTPASADAKPTEPAKMPEPTQPTEPASSPTQPTEIPKLSDVVPTSKVWISGLIGNRQIDCMGPIEIPMKIDKPTYPFTPVPSNFNYENQVFDYDADGGAGKWVPTDAKSQGQLLTDLAKQVTALKDDSQKHDQSADQFQKMGMQLTKVMLQLSSKVDALNTKIDGIVKDGDK